MNHWKLLDKTEIPNGGGEMELLQRANEFSIRLSGNRGELMNSRLYNSEEALAELGCAHLTSAVNAQVLVGGLGMGYTLAAVLKTVSDTAKITVAELIPAVIEWNRGALGECAGQPLLDGRIDVYAGDVVDLFSKNRPIYDAVLLDVDNGPDIVPVRPNAPVPALQRSGCSILLRGWRDWPAVRPWICGWYNAGSSHQTGSEISSEPWPEMR